VMELYISDHPLDCLTCSANGDCELQDMAGAVGLRDVRYEAPPAAEMTTHFKAKDTSGIANPLYIPRDDSNPYFSYDPQKCIVCSRCVRACEEVQGTFALTIQGRGFDSRVSFGAKDDNALASDCVSCGACVQACPTATLQEKSIIDIGTPSHSVITTCAYCGVGCSFKAEMRGDELVRMTPYKHGKANRGHSCVKGRFAYGYAKPSTIRGAKCPGTRRSAIPPTNSKTCRQNTGGGPSAASHPAAARTKKPTSCKS
jgi:formate dehydrogenase major subunit